MMLEIKEKGIIEACFLLDRPVRIRYLLMNTIIVLGISILDKEEL